MPTGKVKWYDAEKGFGFVTNDSGGDVYVRSAALPAGVHSLRSGTRVEFDVVQGRRGDHALQVRLVDPPASVSRAMRKPPAEMEPIVEDLMRLLEGLQRGYRNGHHPDARTAKPTAKLLRALAEQLEL